MTACDVLTKCILNVQAFKDIVKTLKQQGFQSISANALLCVREDVQIPLPIVDEIISRFVLQPMNKIEQIRYFWEYAWEETRKMFATQMPSRLNSLFLFDNTNSAIQFAHTWDIPNIAIVEVQPINSRKLTALDKVLFDAIETTIAYNDFLQVAKKYWAGAKSASPEMEYLFQGTYNIL